MLKKLKNSKGSAMTLAILVIFLVGITGVTITSMVINQMKSTMKTTNTIDLKYDTEAKAEKVIGEYIDKIDINGERTQIPTSTDNNFNILTYYVEIADILVGDNSGNGNSNGNGNGNGNNKPKGNTINAAIEEMKTILAKETLLKSDLVEVIDLIDANVGSTGGSREGAKESLKIAREYIQSFLDNLYEEGSDTQIPIEDMDIENNINLINCILDNLSRYSLSTKVKGTTYYSSGNAGLIHRNIIKFKGNSSQSNIQEICEAFGISNTTKNISTYGNIANRIDTVLDEFDGDDLNDIIDDIKDLDHEIKLEEEIQSINKGTHLKYDLLKSAYNSLSTGRMDNLKADELVKRQIKIVKLEINMLLHWLNVYRDLNSSPGLGSGGVVDLLRIRIPKEIILDDGNTIAKPTNVERDYKNNPNIKLIINSDEYVFELESNQDIILNLDVQSQEADYKIVSDIDMIINAIMTDVTYNVSYNIKSWEREN